MKVIFATDFYASSSTARALLMRFHWPPASRVELLHVLPAPRRPSLLAARVEHSQEILDAARQELRAFATDLTELIERSSGSLHYTLRVGDPAQAIVERARTLEADLVVIGGPGRAESASGKLSEVSATVVRQAPCSVLVVRKDSIVQVVAAGALSAAREVAGWPLFRPVLPTPLVVDPRGADIVDVLRELDGSVLIARTRREIAAAASDRHDLVAPWSLTRR